MSDPILVSQKRAAELLGCTERRIHQLRAAGDLDAVKDGSSVRIVYASIVAYVATLRAA